MLFEFIATIAAAFGMAGLALIITHLSKLAGKRAPKWLIPLFAAIGMFAFQIHQEYNWYGQQVSKLPAGVQVVKVAKSTEWFRPWSYIKPQILRFIAADTANASVQVDNPDVYLVNLYLFERRRSVQKIPQVIDCRIPTRADYVIPEKNSKLTIDEHVKQTTAWRELVTDDPLFISICTDKS
ncbi:hypothetical protein JCM18902_2854 [Psychrobacter sp. JCM 18902]|uniref:hypothetical protein n=1 Tax=Psychrobacter sp. JCM 18902 TaxID=1298607 RepID=UPI000436A447|nr:hypothetical protein [Psychrobacter sp. JCM 18902]GAF59961.1 hypothetical protein JCM18902_2854 [Psychrobacter sp. JCM 18902]